MATGNGVIIAPLFINKIKVCCADPVIIKPTRINLVNDCSFVGPLSLSSNQRLEELCSGDVGDIDIEKGIIR